MLIILIINNFPLRLTKIRRADDDTPPKLGSTGWKKRSSFFVLFESSVVYKNSSYLDRINRIYRIEEEALTPA